MPSLYKLSPDFAGWMLARDANHLMYFDRQWDALLHVFGQPHSASLIVYDEDGSVAHQFEHRPQRPAFRP